MTVDLRMRNEQQSKQQHEGGRYAGEHTQAALHEIANPLT